MAKWPWTHHFSNQSSRRNPNPHTDASSGWAPSYCVVVYKMAHLSLADHFYFFFQCGIMHVFMAGETNEFTKRNEKELTPKGDGTQ